MSELYVYQNARCNVKKNSMIVANWEGWEDHADEVGGVGCYTHIANSEQNLDIPIQSLYYLIRGCLRLQY